MAGINISSKLADVDNVQACDLEINAWRRLYHQNQSYAYDMIVVEIAHGGSRSHRRDKKSWFLPAALFIHANRIF